MCRWEGCIVSTEGRGCIVSSGERVVLYLQVGGLYCMCRREGCIVCVGGRVVLCLYEGG